MKTKFALLILVLLFTGKVWSQSEGKIDSSFGSAGKITIPVFSGFLLDYLTVTETVTQSDGKIIALLNMGYYGDDVSWDSTVLCRILPEGKLDSTYGVNGFQHLTHPASTITLLSNDQILVFGNDVDNELIVSRYNANGVIDNTFGGIGSVYTGMFMYVYDVVIQPDGKILVLSDGLLLRLEKDGNRDFTFGVDGYISLRFDPSNNFERFQRLLLQSDGKIVVGGLGYVNQYKLACLRLLQTGELDPSFAGDGSHSYSVSTYYIADMLLDYKGNIVFGCTNLNSSAILISRIKSNGDADSTFGLNGLRNTTFGTGSQYLRDMLLQPNGKLLCIGSFNESFGLLRLDQAGNLDNTFNGTGKNSTSFGSSLSSVAESVIFVADKKMLVLGSSMGKDPNDSLALLSLARYSSGVHLGLSEDVKVLDMLLYPNPVDQELEVQYEVRAESTVSILIYNMQGELVETVMSNTKQTAGIHHKSIKLDNPIQSGNYVLMVSDGMYYKAVKFVKQ